MWLVSGGLGVWGGGRGIFQAVWVAVLRGTARHKKGGGLWGEGNYATILLSR